MGIARPFCSQETSHTFAEHWLPGNIDKKASDRMQPHGQRLEKRPLMWLSPENRKLGDRTLEAFFFSLILDPSLPVSVAHYLPSMS